RRLEGLLPVHDRDALGDPVEAHPLERGRPDLQVVRDHEVLGDSRPEPGLDPLVEVRVSPGPVDRLRLDQPDEALDHGLLGERREVVLEGIADVAVLELDPALPVDPAHAVLAQELVQERVEVGIAGEDDVARDVPRVALRVLEARAEPAEPVGPLEDLEAVLTALAQPVGRAEAGRPAAQDYRATQRTAMTSALNGLPLCALTARPRPASWHPLAGSPP